MVCNTIYCGSSPLATSNLIIVEFLNIKEMEANQTKTCLKCGRTLSVDNFYTSKNTKDGFRTYCKECYNKQTQLNRIKKKLLLLLTLLWRSLLPKNLYPNFVQEDIRVRLVIQKSRYIKYCYDRTKVKFGKDT